MYAIISGGQLIALCDKPRYIIDNPETGLFIEASGPEEAIGVSVGGVLFNINDSEAIPDAPNAIVTPAEGGEYIFRNTAKIEDVETASSITFVTLAETGSIDDVTAGEHAELFPQWAYPIKYTVGQIRRYGDDLYKCLQDHESQESWMPDVSPSLWVKVYDPAEEWPAWRQPIASTDAYAVKAKVSHNDKHWVSDTDNNVWEPGVYGWTEAIE